MLSLTFNKAVIFMAMVAPLSVWAADDLLQPTCGVAGDAVLSDCQALLDGGLAPLDFSRTCTFRDGGGLPLGKAFNPICSPGNCCIYVSNEGYKDQPDALKFAVQKILGCGAADKNKVNGAIPASVGTAFSVCISDGKGCGDCFDSFEDPNGGGPSGIIAPSVRKRHIRGRVFANETLGF